MNNEDNYKVLLLDFRKEFVETVSKKLNLSVSTSPSIEAYNIVAIDESGCALNDLKIKANFVLCPHSTPCRGYIVCNNIISCGMSSKSTFGLSSTNKERSMFSVNRAINLGKEILLPFEEAFVPNKKLTLYENIIIHGIEKLSKPSSYCEFCIIDDN